MSKSYPIPQCDEETRTELARRSRSRSEKYRVVLRARIILGCLTGRPQKELAAELGIRPNTVGDWRRRFAAEGLAGLEDRPRQGQPRKYGPEFRTRVLKKLEEPPPKGQAQWDGRSVAAVVGGSPDAVWRVLRKEGICLQRRRSWCVSADPEFAAKAADVVGLYLNPPENAVVLSLDEKPSLQALERRQGYVKTTSGKTVRGYKSTYRRHGTLNLFTALVVATGVVRNRFTEQKRRVEFLQFMDELVAGFLPGQELHVIMDNFCIHKRNELWLAAHPTVHFHFTPTSASWLNLVEIWFGILERKAVKGGDFHSKEELRQAIEDFITVWNEHAHPFVWRKREVKGAQLRNTIANLRN